jgi:hypothetical protein
MARQQYPLEALRKVRDERAEAQARTLARQMARTSAAQAAVSERERQRREHARRTLETLETERARLAAGSASGADLSRVADFEAGARAQAGLLERCEAEARELLAKERGEEEKLREELSRREAEAKLTRNHEATFHEHNENAALRSEEEAALEQWNARHR